MSSVVGNRLSALLVASLLAGCGTIDPLATQPVASLLSDGAGATARLDWRQAERYFAVASGRTAPGSPEWLRATYGLAMSVHHLQPSSESAIGRAQSLYAAVTAQGGTSDEAGLALIGQAQIAAAVDFYRDKPDLDAAIALYTQVVDGWDGRRFAGVAAFARADLQMATREPARMRQGCLDLEAWLDRHPGDVLAVGMWQWLGNAWQMGLDDPQRAVACLRRAEELGFVANGRQDRNLWRIARLADERLADPALAGEYYRRLIVRFPGSNKAWEAQQRMRALGLDPPAVNLVPGAAP